MFHIKTSYRVQNVWDNWRLVYIMAQDLCTYSQQFDIICIFIPPTNTFAKLSLRVHWGLEGCLEVSHTCRYPAAVKNNLGLCTHTQTRLTPVLSNGKSDRSAAATRQSGLYLRVEQVCAIRSLALSYWFKIEQTVAAHQTTSHWFLLCLYCASICFPFLQLTGTEPLKTRLSFFSYEEIKTPFSVRRMFIVESDHRDQWRPASYAIIAETLTRKKWSNQQTTKNKVNIYTILWKESVCSNSH